MFKVNNVLMRRHNIQHLATAIHISNNYQHKASLTTQKIQFILKGFFFSQCEIEATTEGVLQKKVFLKIS